MFALVLSLVVFAAPPSPEPTRAKLIEMISAKPFGNHDPYGEFHRTPHSPVTNATLMSLVDDSSLNAEQKTAAFVALRNQRQDEAVVIFMRTRYPNLRGTERHVAAALLVDVSAQDRERIFKDFDSGDLEFDYAVLNELSKERPRPPVSPVIVERIKTALKTTKDAYLKVNATNALKTISAAPRP